MNREHRMRRGITCKAGISATVALTAVVVLASAAAAAAAVAPVGWAPYGDAHATTVQGPRSQEAADDQYRTASCGTNSALLFRVRGSGSKYGNDDALGAWTSAAGGQLIKRGWNVRDLQAEYAAPGVPYQAAGLYLGGAAALNGARALIRYRNEVSAEAPKITAELTRAYDRCPSRKILIAGWSQGSLVLRIAIPRLGSAVERQIVRVDLFADPSADGRVDHVLAHNGPGPIRPTDHGLDTLSGRLLHPTTFRQYQYGTTAPYTRQYCVPFDLVCDANPYNLGLINVKGESARHKSYPWGVVGAAAGAISPPQATSGGSPGSPSAPLGAPPPAGDGGSSVPAGSHLETVGGATNTWTDYATAGGTHGPTIQTGQTVGVACKVRGFRVADGDTWWYQIASSPWNNGYFASADAFHNNGETTGTLHGTPFVDADVPDCAGSTAAPPPAAASRAETTGGVTHTWTNYANAGGNEGPTIPSGQTVQILCKVQGFRVADGDTWWYRIGSPPWSSSYYASADAFYNNGRTSGSLQGTPFVDLAVADC